MPKIKPIRVQRSRISLFGLTKTAPMWMISFTAFSDCCDILIFAHFSYMLSSSFRAKIWNNMVAWRHDQLQPLDTNLSLSGRKVFGRITALFQVFKGYKMFHIAICQYQSSTVYLYLGLCDILFLFSLVQTLPAPVPLTVTFAPVVLLWS